MIHSKNRRAHAVAEAIQSGDLLTSRRLLRENPGLAKASFGPGPRGAERTLPHVATEPRARHPNGAGTALHWAASTNDVAALDALLDAGADIEAPGGTFGGGTPLGDAVGFGQWQAARRLIERGAQTTLWQAAALGLRSRIRDCFPDGAHPAREEVDAGFWYACRCGQFNSAIFILHEGADLNRIPEWKEQTPLDAACLSGEKDLVQWLHSHGARPATDLR
ncbi:ankyrin repeat domain-containing protein [Pseudarthrobacter sp. NPDC080039]|uniref:ankyrin repeat domain-containing protein n=1 Tax=unclassified Pseudarthrobacter TaxID=2647000 RepID=UPI00344DFCC3